MGEGNRKYAHIMDDQKVLHLWLHRYTGIVRRCCEPTCPEFKSYGARGIKIHEPWLRDRKVFLRYAKKLPHWDDITLDLDRRNNDGHYEPGNLRLVSRKVNSRNKRTSVYVEFRSERITVAEFWERYLPNWRSSNAVWYHVQRGRSPEWIVAKHDEGRKGFRSLKLRFEK
jgi:hypothetical protein